MGLDNSIEVRRTETSNKIRALKRFEESWDKEHKYDFVICYWRKSYNVRSRIFGATSSVIDGGYGVLTIEDIRKIIKELNSFTADNWYDDGGSIWTYEEMKPRLKQNIKDLKRLMSIMKRHDIQVVFVDSY